MENRSAISLWAAVSMGIGAMVGAGIFSLLGVGGKIAGSALWFSFVIAGAATLLIVYSYAKLEARYPSAGGPTEFLVKGLGDGVLSGGFNVLLWISYIFALALYSRAFGGYAAAFLPENAATLWVNVFATGIVVVFTAINFIGASAVDRSEKYIVATKIAILVGFVGLGLFSIHPSYLVLSQWPPFYNIISAAAIVFLAYQGFSLITNTAEDMENPIKTVPKALFVSISIVIIIYVAVAVTVLGNLPVPQIIVAKDYALAQAAQPFLGTTGFKVVAIAALLSTASGINATLYGGANISYILAKEGQLPDFFERKIW
jgi:amino acid transporter